MVSGKITKEKEKAFFTLRMDLSIEASGKKIRRKDTD